MKTFHRPKTYRTDQPDNRATRTQRGYDQTWQRLRIALLSSNPWCQDCLQRGEHVLAQEVHHLAKVADRPDLRLDESNLLPLCKRCHSARTARGE